MKKEFIQFKKHQKKVFFFCDYRLTEMDDKQSSNTSVSFNITIGTFRLDYKYKMVNNFK